MDSGDCSPSGTETPCAGNGEAVMDSPAGRRPSVLMRGLGPLTLNGLRHSTLTLTSTALGGGVLSVSYVLRLSGLVLGTVMIMTGGFLAFLSTALLMRMTRATGHDTYAGLFSHCAGRLAGPILDMMLFVYGNGSCIGYMVFVGDFVPSLMHLIPGVPAWAASRHLPIICTALIVAPIAMKRDLAILRYVAPVSILTLVFVTLTVAIKTPWEHDRSILNPAATPLKLAEVTPRLLEAFAICIFAFNCHLNVVPVAGSMVRPTKARIYKVSMQVNLLQMAFYGLIGITGYVSFMQITAQDVLKNYAYDDPAIAVGRVLLTCTMMVAIPLNLNPTVRSGVQVKNYFCGTQSEGLLATDGSMVSSPAAGSPTGDTDVVLRCVLTAFCLLVQCVIAIETPGVADIMGLLGATVATAMMLAIPAYCLPKILPMSPMYRAAQVVLYCFAVVSLMSVPIKIIRLCGYDL